VIARLIHWSIGNRVLVLIVTALTVAWGVAALRSTPLDALPDLSDTQVIVKTAYPGQAPQVVEDQLTYPLTTTMLSVPGARTVRGYSLFGESFVYVLFADGTDPYWARSRVLEYLSQLQGRLPEDAKPQLGPDATGVGWIYEYALLDRSGGHELSELRALQDWFLKYELKTVPDVAEVATIGGMVKQYQIVLDPQKLRALRIPIATVESAVRRANNEAGGSVVELAEAEYMVRARGYLGSLEDFRNIPVGLGDADENRGTPILLRDLGWVQTGPELRRGIAELDGEGEVVGGVIVLRSGRNALAAIEAVKRRLETLKASLPPGVELVTTYDRSQLIRRAVGNLQDKLVEEFLVVAIVCAAFLFHLRSALVAILTLPIGVLVAFIVMRAQGVSANLMSLGGIAIAIGAMVDAAVVMIENAHKKLEAFRHAHQGREPDAAEHRALIAAAAAEVGPALFASLLIITLSFVPVFLLPAQSGRLFAPLAYTKTYAMAAAAGLSVTLVPVLMQLFVRGRIREEASNPINRALAAAYRPAIRFVLAHPRTTLLGALLLVAVSALPALRLGSEFMPPLEEGDLLYMPTALPGLSASKAGELLQQTDRILKTFPEVEHVFGKAGRADTATDPAPLEMFETVLRLKPRAQWPQPLTTEQLIARFDAALKIPGLGNVWVQPIRNRIDMLSTGIKSPLGVKLSGPDIAVIERLSVQIEQLLKTLPGTASAFAERTGGGRYIDIVPDRVAAARYGLSVGDLQDVIRLAVGGDNIGQTIEGLQRFPISLRYPREVRDSVEQLRQLPIVTAAGASLTLGMVAQVSVSDGPPMIKSENARPSGWIYVDLQRGAGARDLGSYVREAQHAVAQGVPLPPGYSIAWSGQYEYLAQAAQRLAFAVPFALAIILLLLYLVFRDLKRPLLIMGSLPFALVGGVWLLWLLGQNLSVASAVGFIALAGVAAEFGVVMLVYLDAAVQRRAQAGALHTREDWIAALVEGSALRLRPKTMTVTVILAGLLPLFLGHGAGSEVMQRIAAPMIGGMISAPLLSLFVVPAAYLLMVSPRVTRDRRRIR
jgi:Cu(I)/Ag(I) efflux system membrane protein CusA/SilA